MPAKDLKELMQRNTFINRQENKAFKNTTEIQKINKYTRLVFCATVNSSLANRAWAVGDGGARLMLCATVNSWLAIRIHDL